MAYGTSEITTYGIFNMTYGVIFAGMTKACVFDFLRIHRT